MESKSAFDGEDRDSYLYRIGYNLGWDGKVPENHDPSHLLGWEDGRGDRKRKYSTRRNVSLKDEQKSLLQFSSLSNISAAQRISSRMIKKNIL